MFEDCHKKKHNDKICKVYYSCTPGPRGPAGPSFNTYLMAHNNATVALAEGDSIPFNSIDVLSNLSVTPAGIITIPNEGVYQINFWINATNTSDAAQVLSVSLENLTPGAEILTVATTGESVEANSSEIISGYAIIEAVNNQTLQISTNEAFTITAVDGYSSVITINRIN